MLTTQIIVKRYSEPSNQSKIEPHIYVDKELQFNFKIQTKKSNSSR